MKKAELVTIHFTHNGVKYSAIVYKYSVTAIILPNRTVLITTMTKPILKRHPQNKRQYQITRERQIFDYNGDLNPLKILYRPGNWNQPKNIRFDSIFADEI